MANPPSGGPDGDTKRQADPAFVGTPSKESTKQNSPSVSAVATRSTTFSSSGSVRTLIFGSEWYFTPDSVRTLRQGILQTFSECTIFKCDYHTSRFLWNIQCSFSEADDVANWFFEYVDALEKVDYPSGYEGAFDDTPYNGTEYANKKIIRLSEWKLQQGLSDIELSSSSPKILELEKIRSCEFKHSWNYETAEGFLPEYLLGQLRSLIGCELESNESEGKILVGAHSEKSCIRAVGKLDNIRKYSKCSPGSRNAHPIRHLYYTENLKKVQYIFRYFSDSRERYMESTLLDNLQLCLGNNYWNLYDGCTIVLAPYITTPISMWQEYQAPELVAATPPEKAHEDISREFKDFTFQAKGKPLKKSDIMSTPCSSEPHEFRAEASGNHDLSTGATSQALPTLQERPTTTEWFTDSDRAIDHGELSEHVPEGVVPLPLSGNVESSEHHKKGKWETYHDYGGEIQAEARRTTVRPPTTIAKIVATIHKNAFNQSIVSLLARESLTQCTDKSVVFASTTKGLSRWETVPQVANTAIIADVTNGVAPPARESLSQTKHRVSIMSTSNSTAALGRTSLIQAVRPSALSQPPFTVSDPENSKQTALKQERSKSKKADRPSRLISSEEEEEEALTRILRQGVNILDSDNLELDTEFEVLQPVRLSAQTQGPTSPVDLVPVGSCICAPGDNLQGPERLQEEHEASTRKFFNTMNQKGTKSGQKKKAASKSGEFATRLGYSISPPKPAPKKKPWDGPQGPDGNPLEINNTVVGVAAPNVDRNPDFFQNEDSDVSHFEEIMKGVRGFRGEVVVCAEFGRIILKNINSKHISHDGKERLRVEKNMTNILQPHPEKGALYPYAFFSKVLTTVPGDISYLVDMKDSKGQKLWAKKLPWKVNYQFLGHDESSNGVRANAFIIDIDGENFKCAVKMNPRTLGEIFVHGTKRNWDFRVSAVGNERFEEGCDETREGNCGQLADIIKKSLYVPEKSTKPYVEFEIPNSLIGHGKLVIDGIRCQRITEYETKDRKSLLRVSEITELTKSQMEVPETDTMIFVAEEKLGYRPGCESVDFWHEVSISSIEVNKVMQQNLNLELGDEAAWTPKQLSKLEGMEAMCLPAFEMLKQMDGVGFWNENLINRTYRQESDTLPTQDSQQKPRFQWW